jgi:hypothetical protein
MKLVDLNKDSKDSDVLHFDMARMKPVVDAAFAAIRAEAIAQNPDIANAAELPLCGGCSVTLIGALVERFKREDKDADIDTKMDFENRIIRRIETGSFMDALFHIVERV